MRRRLLELSGHSVLGLVGFGRVRVDPPDSRFEERRPLPPPGAGHGSARFGAATTAGRESIVESLRETHPAMELNVLLGIDDLGRLDGLQAQKEASLLNSAEAMSTTSSCDTPMRSRWS